MRPARMNGLVALKRQEAELEAAEGKMSGFSFRVTKMDRIRNE